VHNMPRCSLLRVKNRSKRATRTNSKVSILKSKFEKNGSDGIENGKKIPHASIVNTQNCSTINNNLDHNDGISHSRDVNLLKNKKSMKLFSFLNRKDRTPSRISPTSSMEIWDEGTKDGTIETDDYSSNSGIQQGNDLLLSTSTKDTLISLQPISDPSLGMASFSGPAPQEELSTSAPTQLTSVTPGAFPSNLTQTRAQDHTRLFVEKIYRPVCPFNVVPLNINKDLSFEDKLSVSHLPADLSMDAESILAELHVISEEDGEFRTSMDDLPDMPHDTNDLGQQNMISRPRTSLRSSSEGTVRMMSDINCELNSENTFSILGSSTNSMSYQHLDNKVIENKSHSNNANIDDSNVVKCKDNSSDNRSKGMTASLYTHVKESYLNNFGGKEEKDPWLSTPNSSYSDLSILGLFEDSKSCHSCTVSFDSMDFQEDEQFDHNVKKTTSCTIPIHDIATTYKDNDIVDNDKIQMGWSETNQECQSFLFNRELEGRILQLSSQGTTDFDNFSSVTYDSYLSERGNSPRQSGRKNYQDTVNVNINDHEDYVKDVQPILQQPLNNEPSQFILEASHVTSSESVCSYDSFSSKSLKYMLDILKEEKERRSINIPVELMR